jgi:23S rRNA pseudouridine1911/1915/1917 synthase
MKNLIVYEDNNILICNKPVGMASQSERSFDVDLLSKVLTYRTEKGEDAYAAIINRLDKPVGGLVLFAKDKRTAAGLSAISGKHSIEKYYYAVVTGNPGEKGEYTDWLLKESKGNVSRAVAENTTGAKKAVLNFTTLETKEIEGVEYSLVKVRLMTGRHHQIRLQFATHGHGLYGDMKYNPAFADRRGVTPALFAYHLGFDNPVGAYRISVEVKPEGAIWDFEYFK